MKKSFFIVNYLNCGFSYNSIFWGFTTTKPYGNCEDISIRIHTRTHKQKLAVSAYKIQIFNSVISLIIHHRNFLFEWKQKKVYSVYLLNNDTKLTPYHQPVKQYTHTLYSLFLLYKSTSLYLNCIDMSREWINR